MFLQAKTAFDTMPHNEVKHYNGIDLVKFICAVLVVAIHIPPFSVEPSQANFVAQHFICRVAVPFYFASSGFFLFKKMPLYQLDHDRIRNYCFKILRLLGIWHVLLFLGDTGHLWYLGATVIAIILLSLCLHFRLKLGWIYAIACVLYAAGLLGDAYYGIIAPLENISPFRPLLNSYRFFFETTRNGVFMGFIFVLLGATFASRKITLKKQTALIGFVLSMLCLGAEALLLNHYDIPAEHNMYVFLLPATFFLFSFATQIELKDRPIYKHLRKMGMILYFSHLLINEFVLLMLCGVKKYCGIVLFDHQFLISLLCTLLVAMFIDWLSGKERFKWLDWLIGG